MAKHLASKGCFRGRAI